MEDDQLEITEPVHVDTKDNETQGPPIEDHKLAERKRQLEEYSKIRCVFEPDAEITQGDLYYDYMYWAGSDANDDVLIMTKIEFLRTLEGMYGPDVGVVRSGDEYVWRGVRLVDDEEMTPLREALAAFEETKEVPQATAVAEIAARILNDIDRREHSLRKREKKLKKREIMTDEMDVRLEEKMQRLGEMEEELENKDDLLRKKEIELEKREDVLDRKEALFIDREAVLRARENLHHAQEKSFGENYLRALEKSLEENSKAQDQEQETQREFPHILGLILQMRQQQEQQKQEPQQAQ